MSDGLYLKSPLTESGNLPSTVNRKNLHVMGESGQKNFCGDILLLEKNYIFSIKF